MGPHSFESVPAPPPEAGRPSSAAVHPYPSDIRERWRLADGSVITVRPIRPEDAQMEASFVRKLSQRTKYLRFLVPLHELSEELLDRFTHVDYDRELALVAVVERDGNETQIAVARYVTAQDGRSAETAIVVADEWQGKGIGIRLFRRLIEAARVRGIPRLDGEMLAENERMRAMLAQLGFRFRRNPESPDMICFELDLT